VLNAILWIMIYGLDFPIKITRRPSTRSNKWQTLFILCRAVQSSRHVDRDSEESISSCLQNSQSSLLRLIRYGFWAFVKKGEGITASVSVDHKYVVMKRSTHLMIYLTSNNRKLSPTLSRNIVTLLCLASASSKPLILSCRVHGIHSATPIEGA
jgi:hypothetical protein